VTPQTTSSRSDALKALLARIPYAQFLGLRVELAGDEMTAILPFSPHLIGNPSLPAIHGGVLGAFMELTALAQLAVAQETGGDTMRRQPRPIDVTVEYLRSGRPLDTFARAQITRMGRRIANVRVEAWQETRAAPIAALHGHFILTLNDGDPPVP
jgi:acyl-coenzyme A thioesterase PaaI-like protein